MNKYLKIINSYTHDFASALWLATVLVVYWTNKYVLPAGTEEFFLRFKKEFFFIGLGSLAVILFTGIGRTYAYKEEHSEEEAGSRRKEILIVKHIIGLIIYGAGTYWQYVMVYG
jgi:putative copper export protein